MAEQPPVPPTTHDFPDHWGFYLLQAINRLDDKIDEIRREQEQTADALRRDVDQKFAALDAKGDALRRDVDQKFAAFDAKIDALDTKFDQKLTALQYWYWGTLVVIVIGFVTLWLSRP
ncbi:MAG: hypothetical protein C7B45_16990 [Sulfobacillus acidophilus]|uniref:DUF1640 domain-containing protein n=1 Tax=Sulfobacillus acidophilus TaxID=53633 RepID=A0A2T2WCS0_9FIRM|nr:MAG: hypothetical protein C7B45_16990 [Sulfobacillus acidophilus]